MQMRKSIVRNTIELLTWRFIMHSNPLYTPIIIYSWRCQFVIRYLPATTTATSTNLLMFCMSHSSMSWQSYVDQSLMVQGNMVFAGIFGLDGSAWAFSPGFSPRPEEIRKLKQVWSNTHSYIHTHPYTHTSMCVHTYTFLPIFSPQPEEIRKHKTGFHGQVIPIYCTLHQTEDANQK
jgi:hypothetical protein